MKTTKKQLPEASEPAATKEEIAAESYESGVETRGEAAELNDDGTLPPGATHAIVKKPDGTRELKRGRFTMN